MQKPFIHLHTHSHYSLLDGLTKPDEMVKEAKKLGMPALALTDHGAMYGAIEFYKACMKEGIKPIIGVEAYIANRKRTDKESGVDNRRYHLTLLAKNMTGYRNLLKLVTLSHLEGYYYKPRMDKDLLREHHEGLICLSGCFGGELARALQYETTEKARSVAEEYRDIFGNDNYFIEIMHKPEIEGHDDVEQRLIMLARELDIPLVATQDSHYCHTDQKRAHATLLQISTGNESGDALTFECDASFISTETAYELFKNTPEAVENTSRIAEMCNLELSIGKFIFPKFPLEPGKTADQMLDELTQNGIKERGLSKTPELEERRTFELKVIKDKAYSPYFLVVADLLRFAKENHIYTTVRGSAAGSLVAYLSGITNVNPIEFQLPFERFLNPFRPSAPDIDMDFADSRREEVIEYAKAKYGEDKVAQIGTFGTMMARGTVRDVARALGKPYDLGDKIAKLIPMGSQGFPMTIEHALEIEPALLELKNKDAEVREILEIAQKLEGTVRHVSVHAAGVVIAPEDLTAFVPIQFDPKGGKKITQYDMYSVGEDGVGLTKLDFLGIRNLTILAESVRLVEERHGKKIDIEKIPFDDKKTFAMLAHGDTTGLFQLNGSGMTKWLMDLKPSSVYDINAMVALYRPGPMNNIPEYIARKHGKKPITYFHPKAEKFLAKSYGVLVYQDDLLYTAIELAGYDWESVDKFRKAVGKKIPAEMAKQHEIFVKGCKEHSKMSEKEAEKIWELFEPFQGYGFNKAHAACYGRVAYQTAYMKANFPAEYMTAVLSAESGNIETIAETIVESKRMDIPVLPPDINESFGDFTIVDLEKERKNAIRFGLHTIKNLGEGISDIIIAERETRGKFRSFEDVLERVIHRNLNKKSLEALIKSGSLDSLGEHRGVMLANIDLALEYNREHGKNANQDQESLFGDIKDHTTIPGLRLKEAPEIPEKERLAWEKELLGLYVSGHPLEEWRETIAIIGTTVKGVSEEGSEGREYILAGIIDEDRRITTKRGEHMAILKLTDFTGTIEVVLFPRTLTEFKDIVVADTCIKIKGKFSRRNDQPGIIVEKVKALTK